MQQRDKYEISILTYYDTFYPLGDVGLHVRVKHVYSLYPNGTVSSGLLLATEKNVFEFPEYFRYGNISNVCSLAVFCTLTIPLTTFSVKQFVLTNLSLQESHPRFIRYYHDMCESHRCIRKHILHQCQYKRIFSFCLSAK